MNRVKLSILSVMLLFLTGCWDSMEVNKLAFTTAVGIDKAENGYLVTAQVLNPRAIASQKPVNEPSVVLYTEQGDSVFELLRKMNSKSPRRPNGSHMQTIVFGEELAKEGINEIVDFFLRHFQTSPDLYFTVANGTTANNVLSNLSKLENIPSFEINMSQKFSEEANSTAKIVKLIDLVNNLSSDGNNPVLTGIGLINNKIISSTDDLKMNENDPIFLKDIAVFRKDKLVGWLNEEESKGLAFITNNFKRSVVSLQGQSIGKVTLDITNSVTKRKVTIKNGKPSVQLSISLKAKIENINNNYDIMKEENLKPIKKILEIEVEKYCKKSMSKAGSLKSDIFGFGESIHIASPKLWKNLKNNWNDSFSSIPISIYVESEITGNDSINNSFIGKK